MPDSIVSISRKNREPVKLDAVCKVPSVRLQKPSTRSGTETEQAKMSELSAKSFLELVQKSGLVPADKLKQALSELSKLAAGKAVQIEQLSQFLISQGLITQWHYEKLLTGKFKGFFLGQYKLLSLLGTGGMSTVYLAEHSLSGQRRAIKVLPRARVNDKSYLDRFYREGRAAASLSHPNIVRIYDLANEEDVYYMVIEYVPGVDLHQKIQNEGPAKIEDALSYVGQAAEGLAHAHARSIVHRDIKPANLLLTADGTLKILDLGLALVNEERESLTLMHDEKVMGTADFLAPEQAINSHNVDARADIYSLGCTLYYLVTGQPPFAEGSIAQRIAMHQSRDPKPLRELRADCPPLVEALCQRMMKKSPADRIPSCEKLLQAIEVCRESLVPPVTSASEQYLPSASARQATRPVAAQQTSPSTPAKQVPVPAATVPVRQPLKPPAPPTPPTTPPPVPAAAARPAATPKAASAAPAAQAGGAERPKPVAPPSPRPVSEKQSPQTAPPNGPGIVIDSHQVAPKKSVGEVGDLLVQAPARPRKRGKTNSLPANLIVGAIVLICFLVLVGMVIVLARVFGN